MTSTNKPTTLVDLHVEYLRPKYRNLPDWRADPDNLYIGRPGVDSINGKTLPREGSKWQNPFKVGKDGDIYSRLIQYRAHILNLINIGEVSLEELRGKRLGCWCVKAGEISHDSSLPFPNYVCHGQVLMQLLSESFPEENSSSTPLCLPVTKPTEPVKEDPSPVLQQDDFPAISFSSSTKGNPSHIKSNPKPISYAAIATKGNKK